MFSELLGGYKKEQREEVCQKTMVELRLLLILKSKRTPIPK